MIKTTVLLSVILPIYNGQETLSKCINSVLEQEDINLELLCIDDGSTDNSISICQNIAQKDSRIRLITKRNGGVASARNKGLDFSRGTYITFIDQDDWIEKNAYKTMLQAVLTSKADIVVSNYFKDKGDVFEAMINQKKIPETVTTTNDLIKYAFFREEYRGFAAFVWNKMFSKMFLEKNHITFDESLRRGDDVLFFSDIALANPKTIYINQHLYHYVQQANSVTHTLTKENLGRLSEILIGYKQAINKLEKNAISMESLSYMKCFYVYHASILYELAAEKNAKDIQEFCKNAMKLYLLDYIKQNEYNIGRIKRICDLVE